MVPGRQQVVGGNFRPGLDGAHVPGEPAHHRQPVALVDRGRARWLRRPGQCQLGGDGNDARSLEVVDELEESVSLPYELESKSPANGKVLLGMLAEWAHNPAPGQASARPARDAISTFA